MMNLLGDFVKKHHIEMIRLYSHSRKWASMHGLEGRRKALKRLFLMVNLVDTFRQGNRDTPSFSKGGQGGS